MILLPPLGRLLSGFSELPKRSLFLLEPMEFNTLFSFDFAGAGRPQADND
jgi:hypothetical protein